MTEFSFRPVPPMTPDEAAAYEKAHPEEAARIKKEMTVLWCHDPVHETPCPQPCRACEEDCDPKYLRDSELEP